MVKLVASDVYKKKIIEMIEIYELKQIFTILVLWIPLKVKIFILVLFIFIPIVLYNMTKDWMDDFDDKW